jgi:hypothetical protein
MTFSAIEGVANAVLYEGYALYPYRANSTKNRVRFQWGVLMPPTYTDQDPSERHACQTECLMEGNPSQLRVRVRFLHLEERQVEEMRQGAWRKVEVLSLANAEVPSWGEAREEHHDLELGITSDEVTAESTFQLEGHSSITEVTTTAGRPGRIIRRLRPVTGKIRVAVEALASPYGIKRLTVKVENTTPGGPYAGREDALGQALISCHTLLALNDGAFLSLLDPPEWARPFVAECRNDGTFPVLANQAGTPARLLLSSPIILYDHPTTAPESPSDLFDATEIDEILTLRTLTLTDEEKRLARSTDPRTAGIIDHVDQLPPEILARLHGVIRQLGTTQELGSEGTVPWWDPGADEDVSPETDAVLINGTEVSRGSLVRLRPELGGADAQDMFLVGRIGRVEAVFFDVDEAVHLAVTLVDDPGAQLDVVHGRFRYFRPSEVEPLGGGDA